MRLEERVIIHAAYALISHLEKLIHRTNLRLEGALIVIPEEGNIAIRIHRLRYVGAITNSDLGAVLGCSAKKPIVLSMIRESSCFLIKKR